MRILGSPPSADTIASCELTPTPPRRNATALPSGLNCGAESKVPRVSGLGRPLPAVATLQILPT